jgi:hypothetical protein
MVLFSACIIGCSNRTGVTSHDAQRHALARADETRNDGNYLPLMRTDRLLEDKTRVRERANILLKLTS